MNEPDTDLIVLLDYSGKQIGSAPKLASHHADTPLHSAFSTYIFNKQGNLLVTRRANCKKVWPRFWTNSCCGHPAPGESTEAAVRRRVLYELGMDISDFSLVIPDYQYKTPPYNGIIENEVCPIYFARALREPEPFSDEVSEYKWLNWNAYIDALSSDKTNTWSWWCKDQLKHLVVSGELAKFLSATNE